MNNELDEFARHLILYSKHWYVKSDDLIADLKKLFSGISWVEAEHYTNGDIWETVVAAFIRYVEPNGQYEYMKRIFRPYGVIRFQDKADFKQILEAFVGALSVITIRNNPLFPNGLGDPNPEYLPISKAAAERLDKTAALEDKE